MMLRLSVLVVGESGLVESAAPYVGEGGGAVLTADNVDVVFVVNDYACLMTRLEGGGQEVLC